MDNQLHPELAYQAGIEQEKKSYDIHPSLQMELDEATQSVPEQEPEPVVEQQVQPEPAPVVQELLKTETGVKYDNKQSVQNS